MRRYLHIKKSAGEDIAFYAIAGVGVLACIVLVLRLSTTSDASETAKTASSGLAMVHERIRVAVPASSSETFGKGVLPILQDYCYDCHGEGAKKGDFVLDGHKSETALLGDRKLWARVWENVDTRFMPPSGKDQPTAEEREQLVTWIERNIFKHDPANPDPGKVVIRRLNRSEYNNTIRDLLGVQNFRPADDFPSDDSGHGFDNIGSALSMSPVLLEKYIRAAEQVFDKAIVDPVKAEAKAKMFFDAKNLKGGSRHQNTRFLSSNGDITQSFEIGQDGVYTMRVRAYGHQAGREPVKIAILVDRKELALVSVPAEGKAATYEKKIRIRKGTREIGVRFTNDYYEPKAKDKSRRDRNLLVESIELKSPTGAAPGSHLPATHRRLLGVKRPDKGQEYAFAKPILRKFARRAFRRPVGEGLVTKYLRLMEAPLKNGEPFEEAIKIPLTAILVSPKFLFRGEISARGEDPKKFYPVNEHELASRLSYFLWSSIPDERLLDLADKGQLRKSLRSEVRRMLKDPKAEALVENFGGQWLQTRNLDIITPDPKIYPEFNAGLKHAMEQETLLLFKHILRTDSSVQDFINADFSFVNEQLANHYGLSGVRGRQFRKVSLEGTPRRGILGHASVLAITSNPTRTSPVKRGKFILENILGTPPPPPPPNVPELKEDAKSKDGKQAKGIRELMKLHMENATCASCHEKMDPLGFSMEQFDGIGGWRDKDEDGHAFETAGKLMTGEKFANFQELQRILATRKSQEFAQAITKSALTYALGRGLEYFDKSTVKSITNSMKKKDYRFSSLILGIVESVPFQKRRGVTVK